MFTIITLIISFIKLFCKNSSFEPYFIFMLIPFSYLIYGLINYLKNRSSERKRLLFELIEESIKQLKLSNGQSMPILHIRDIILNSEQRKMTYYLKIWDQVVKFIDNNESRVKSSLENIDGEYFKTWKWIELRNEDLK